MSAKHQVFVPGGAVYWPSDALVNYRRITYNPGDTTARFRLENMGAEGQLFKGKFVGCL